MQRETPPTRGVGNVSSDAALGFSPDMPHLDVFCRTIEPSERQANTGFDRERLQVQHIYFYDHGCGTTFPTRIGFPIFFRYNDAP